MASKRMYVVLISEVGQSDMQRVTLNRMLSLRENDYEYMYAISEILDVVLDLKNGESMYFQPNRDNKDSKGIITRNDS